MLEHYPYSYTYNVGNPARSLSGQARYQWLLNTVGPVGTAWTWRIGPDLELVFYFRLQKDHALFALTWG